MYSYFVQRQPNLKSAGFLGSTRRASRIFFRADLSQKSPKWRKTAASGHTGQKWLSKGGIKYKMKLEGRDRICDFHFAPKLVGVFDTPL